VPTERILLRDVSVLNGPVSDVLVADGVVLQVGRIAVSAADRAVEGGGAALLPGLHDHHCHLLATAAAACSVRCDGPSREALLAALGRAVAREPGVWVRGVDYDDAALGPLDRSVLDSAVGATPVRVQDRSGALWVLNSAGLAAVGAEEAEIPGVERDAAGRATGRLWRLDAWLRERVPDAPLDLAALGRRLACYGITGVTDATPELSASAAELLATAHATGALPQRVVLMGEHAAHGLALGPRKIVLADHALPGFDELRRAVLGARAFGRAVALHCVTRESLLLALAVLEDTGTLPGDRIEHAAVAAPEAVALLATARVTVVTQPSFVARRGDDYLARVESEDLAHLWPYRSLLVAGIPVACSSDAPYGDLDPWATVRAAVSRCTRTGAVLGADERVDAGTALRSFLSHPASPGGPARSIDAGAPADLVLLDCDLAAALADPDSARVRCTLIAGELPFDG
jgi:predicted amidohydrolase YtcJ